ncbi:ADP-ribosyl cyclase/cyclic ADP-ribose hydrolase [Citrus sinensis]|uniref:ADP-ribosyl cyclase/cyclic ADP-ribose hydrolase n=1 Tax=Citrus sinensis TaxID=2711 RepID=A0ACB8MD20_CITSI|nr:ADP-ribosyl cyclase/cyclic ADP-ribose hydrolase [Citrus sinensis]
MASSSTNLNAQSKFDVFLSFRGEDTRTGFTSHVVEALRRKQIQFFIDNEELRRGEEISPALLSAIETSDISIIIFSKNYASSTWCLDELVRILDCKKRNGQIVVPVFYKVDPSDMRKQMGSFGEAFVHHERIPCEVRVQKWRDSLIQASNISGFHDSRSFRNDAELVEKIAEDISKKLEDMADPPNVDGFVGFNSQIERIKSLLCLELDDVRIVGIWGMGGIGKTAIAEAVFHQISSREYSNHFDGKCFMRNVREESRKMGALYVRDEAISRVLGESNLKRGTLTINSYIWKRLRRSKVLVVLDDVDDNFIPELESLVGQLNLYGPGSRIIITTRNRGVLGVNSIVYKVKGLEHDKACELFCRKALSRKNRSDDLLELSKKVACYADGNPLALEVLGSSLRQKSKKQWYNKLHDLTLISGPRIYKVLKISYDELTPKHRKIFLDIACFFKGEQVDNVTRIQDKPTSLCYELEFLVDKSLITISSNRLQMHDLLQEMGQTIVREESEEPGERSRLWDHEDVYDVLTKNKEIRLGFEAFENMSNLKWLKFYIPEHCDLSTMSFTVLLDQVFKYLPAKLRYLHWHGYPLKTLPFYFEPEYLIELNLPYSKVQQIWEGEKEALNLKFVDLRNSQFLTRIPQPSEIPNLRKLDLRETAIENVPSLPELRYLHLGNCKMLQSLSELPLFLEMLIASNCKRLQSLPKRPLCPQELDTSIMEILPVPLRQSSRVFMNFNFSNCLKLNENRNIEILADSKERMQDMIVQSLKQSQQAFRDSDEEFAHAVEFTLCLPGSEIPDWFIHRSSESPITVALPRKYFNKKRKFIGFAFCVVIMKSEIEVLCRYRFNMRTRSEAIHFDGQWRFSPDVSIDSDHVILGFFPFWNVGLPDADIEHPASVSFFFYIENKKARLPAPYRLRSCGVSPVHLSPNKTKLNTCTLEFAASTREECSHDKMPAGTSKPSTCVGRSDDGELEPSSKRIRRDQVNPD